MNTIEVTKSVARFGQKAAKEYAGSRRTWKGFQLQR
jgi:hypothetical protein